MYLQIVSDSYLEGQIHITEKKKTAIKDIYPGILKPEEVLLLHIVLYL